MSDTSAFNRWFLVTVAIVVGFIIGGAFAAYLVWAWVPADLILSDSPPLYLRYDPSGATVGYRDIYVARAANRYVQEGQTDLALTQAQQALGVATGDATPMQAWNMALSAENAARQENAREGDQPDAGYFTLVDQNNISALANRLDAVKDQPANVPTEVVTARRNARIFGLLLLLLLIGILGALLFLINSLLRRNVPVSVTPSVSTSSRTVKVEEVMTTPPSQVPSDGAMGARTAAAVAAAAAAGAAAGVAATQAGGPPPSGVRVASPISGETLISSFSSVYEHGDDRYDEGFAINSSTGELIGECGASVADRIGVESPARVTALAVWVFDKNDFHSTTKVLMTDHAYTDAPIRNKLAPRGEPVLARPGMFEVVTSTLRVEVEVRELRMQPVGSEPNGYFDKLDLEFRVFKRMA